MTTRNLGADGFRWFIGVVEDRNDPDQLGRVRVRAHGIHGDTIQAPTDTLPWAPMLMPTTSASLKFVGQTPTGIQVGSTVVGFFIDGNEATLPVIFGVLPGKGDITPLAVGDLSLNKRPLGPEPETPYNAKYPYNKVHQTESGHVFEVDDTPNFERIHQYHRTGTYNEVDQKGNRVNKIVGNDYEIVQENQTIYIQGNVNIQVKGSYTLNVTGPIVMNGSSINLNNGTQGAARIGDTVANDDGAGDQPINQGSSTVLIGG